MKDCAGDPSFPIWLIGDSPPEAWAEKLDTPLDPKHPARHSIWTSVADSIQERLYRQKRLRLDTSRLYIRNAMGQTKDKQALERHRYLLEELLFKYSPNIILAFGTDAFRMTLLASHDPHQILFQTTEKETIILGEEFRRRIDNYDAKQINVIPLLHVSIARGKFLEAHKGFIGNDYQSFNNYFEYVGVKLADTLLASFYDKPIRIV
jgi:hypothetical protein